MAQKTSRIRTVHFINKKGRREILCSLKNPSARRSPLKHSPFAIAIAIAMETGRTVKDVSPHEFVKAYAAHLKRSGKMELPHWTDIVKTARFKELAPYDPDWYYIRAASMARKIYLRHGIGVGGFQKIYGGRRRNGSCPPHFCKSSGAVARHILQQLQKMDIIDIDPKGGRLLTSQGRRDLDQVAGRVLVVP
ncbi:40S ribosomal protein S19 [Rhynchospora pubera]|uniref:40S ribosomal protein S19 n=2 Tax=Rhynchospora pubera TaxID=906938 RepID=A0AAV8HWD4_9POAL|nr:40S ribosomal protein S19 [Rhynchospora pubera]